MLPYLTPTNLPAKSLSIHGGGNLRNNQIDIFFKSPTITKKPLIWFESLAQGCSPALGKRRRHERFDSLSEADADDDL